MKKLLSLVFILVSSFSFQALSLQITSQLEENNNGELEKQVVVTCERNESALCDKLCSDEFICIRPETLCQDCVGLKNQALRTAFTDLPYLYRPEPQSLGRAGNLNFVTRTDYSLLGYDSYLNIFNSNKKDQIKAQFLSFCPSERNNPTLEALLIVSLNADQQAQQFVGVICTNAKKQSRVFPLQYNPEYSSERISYFDPVPKLRLDQEMISLSRP